jgi:hypothetical protein
MKTTEKPQYKIVKKLWFDEEFYFVYKRHFFGLLWKVLDRAKTEEIALKTIKFDKSYRELKKNSKPEVIGYY